MGWAYVQTLCKHVCKHVHKHVYRHKHGTSRRNRNSSRTWLNSKQNFSESALPRALLLFRQHVCIHTTAYTI